MMKQTNSVLSALKKREASQAEEQKAGVPSASSDKQSEEGSTSQDNPEKKKRLNPQQHRTKGLKKQRIKFDIEKRPELLTHMAKMVPDRPLRLKTAN